MAWEQQRQQLLELHSLEQQQKRKLEREQEQTKWSKIDERLKEQRQQKQALARHRAAQQP